MAIQFFDPKHTLENLPTSQIRRVIALDRVVERLSNLRQELETLAETNSTSLIDQKVSAGFLLLDFCDALELAEEERGKVFGALQVTINNFVQDEAI